MKTQIQEQKTDLGDPLCKIHKRNIEFKCVNNDCSQWQQGGCSKCLQPNQTHYQCDVIYIDDEQQDKHLNKEQKKLIDQLEFQINELNKNVTMFFTKGKELILRQIQQGNEEAQDTASSILYLLKEMNQIETYEQQSKSLLISDIWEKFEDFQEICDTQQSSQSSKCKSFSLNHEMSDLNACNSNIGISILDQSSISMKDDQLSISNVSNSSRKKVQLINRPQNIIDEISSQSSNNQSQSINSSVNQSLSQYSQTLSSSGSRTINQKNYRPSNTQQIPLGQFKWKDSQKFKIQSDYIDTFYLFETKFKGSFVKNQNSMTKEFETDTDSADEIKRYFLITRCEKQALQVFDLQKMVEVSRIYFSFNSEIIQFKQLNEKEIVIFGQNNNFIWIQNIFDESQFTQIDFKYAIDCIECDKDQNLLFLGHQLGKISVWNAKSKETILNSHKIHSKKILEMDYSYGKLLTCCESGSVKEFIFNFEEGKIFQKQVFRKELLSEELEESITQIKIINENIVMVQINNEFIEVYKDGQKQSDETLEYFSSLNDMKIYEGKYGILRSCEDENVAFIFDFVNLQQKGKSIKLNKEDYSIIGTYYLNNQLILLLENELIIKYF